MSPAQGSDALQAFTAAPLLRPGPVGVQFSGFCGQRSSLLRRSPWARTSSDAHQDRVQRRKTFSFSYESPRPFDVFAIVASEVQRPITITPSLAPRLARTDFGDEYLNILESAADLDLSGRPRTVNNGFPHTDESKAKISAANKGKTPWNKGRKHSEETKRKIAEATRAAMQKPGMIAKMRQNQLGKKHKPETKEKIKERLHDPDVQAKIVAARVKRYGFPEERARLREEREEVRQREMEARRHLVREIQEAGELAFAAGLQSAMPLLVPPSCCSGVYGSYPRPLDADRVIALERRLASNAPPTASRRGATHMSEETRAKLRVQESIRARWQDPEYRAKHAAGMAGKGIGRKLSEAHKAKIRETLLRRSAAIHGMDPDEAVERGTAVVGARTRDRRSSSSASGGFLLTRRSLAREAGVTSLGGTADLTNRRYESGSGSEDGRGSLRGSGVAVRTGDNGNGSGSLGGAGASQSRAREPQLKGLFGSLYKDEEEEKPAPSPRPREAASAARLSPSPAASPKRKEPKEPKPRGRPRQAPKALDEDLEIDASDINLDGFDDEVVTATPPRRRAAADDDDDIRDAWADDEEEEEEAPAPVKRKRAAARPSKRRSKAEEIVYRKVYKNGRLVEVQAVPAEKKDAFWYLRHSQSFW
eukprot:tig00020911_g15748.t2